MSGVINDRGVINKPVVVGRSVHSGPKEGEMEGKLSEQYPYLYAWGYMLGSQEYYMEHEARAAKRDNAPADVIYRRDFNQITPAERDHALELEPTETVVIVRDALGSPERVWFTLRAVRSRETRERVQATVDRLKQGRSPWSTE